MTDPDVLELTVDIKAEPDTVFPYFTDPARYGEWMGGSADLDPVPGGTYRAGMRDGVQAVGRFVGIDPPRRVVFTWGWTDDPEVPPGSARVVVTFEPIADGTRVVLRHYGLSEAQRDHHAEGWTRYLDRLSIRATGGDPGPDPNTDL